MFRRFLIAFFVASFAGAAWAQALPDTRSDEVGFLKAALAALCGPDNLDAASVGAALGDAALLDDESFEIEGRPGRWQRRYRLDSGDEVQVLRHFPGGTLRRFSLELYRPDAGGSAQPRITAVAGGDCQVVAARRIATDADGRGAELEILDTDLITVIERESLDPPVPAGTATPEGVRVAVFDSGVNYTLPEIATRLARGADGATLGYDFWDLDPRPFDSHPVGSPFFPLRHGTTVASVLLREAPEAWLVPFRYPRPDMARMADMIAAAAAAGARIVAVPMGSDKQAEWDAFAEAAAAHPDLLFVISAGNNGRDIDLGPVYPAALPNENFLVVTSSDPFGRLAEGSNWGLEAVDVMVPAEGLEVIDFQGRAGRASGSSYAVPRVAALAARLLAAHPDWQAAELKRAILDRAAPALERTPTTRYGWIPDPSADG